MKFKDREVQYPGRVRLNSVEGNLYDLERAEGTVEEEGTPINAATLNQLTEQLDGIDFRLSILETDKSAEDNFVSLGYDLGYVSLGGATDEWIGYNTDTKQVSAGNSENSQSEIMQLYKGHSFNASENYGRSVVTYIKAKTGKLKILSNYPPAGFTEKQVTWLRVEYIPSHEAGSIKYID